jgi:hypothetical protein
MGIGEEFTERSKNWDLDQKFNVVEAVAKFVIVLLDIYVVTLFVGIAKTYIEYRHRKRVNQGLTKS